MKKVFLMIAVLFFVNDLVSQKKIRADIKIMNYLGRIPQKVERNAMPDNLIKMLYFKKQSKGSPKLGYMDTKGEVRVEPKYNMGLDFYGDYANVIKDSIYGFVNTEGDETLFTQYDDTFFYYGDTGIARKKNRFGLINRKGDSLTGFKYTMINVFGTKHFNMYTKEKQNVVFDENGKVVFKNKLNFNIKSFHFESDSLLVYEEIIEGKKLKGLVNLNEKVIVKPQYDNIYQISDEEFFSVVKDNKWGFIDKTGEIRIPLIYDKVRFDIAEHLISVKKNDKWGFVNRKNETVIPFAYNDANAFMQGLSFVEKDGKYGCINVKNKPVIKFDLEKTAFQFFINDMALIKKGGKYGFINKKGKIKIPAIYDNAYPFVEELAYVELDGKSGFINKKGVVIIQLSNKQYWFESSGLIRYAE